MSGDDPVRAERAFDGSKDRFTFVDVGRVQRHVHTLACVRQRGAAGLLEQPLRGFVAELERLLVNWPDAPAQGNVTTYWEIATDPSFSPASMYGTDGNSCTLPNYACWTSFAAQKAYGPPFGRTFYWRIIFNGVTSAVGSFRVVLAPDLAKPRVKAYGGSARRGRVAHFMARAADDRGPVRYRATLEWRGLTVLGSSFPFSNTVWSAPVTFYSKRPLPKRMPAGRYQFCITAHPQVVAVATH